MTMIACICGTLLLSLVIVFMTEELQLDAKEQHVIIFIYIYLINRFLIK
jgi:hypothetical protein